MRFKSVATVGVAFVLPWILLALVSPRAIYDTALNTAWHLAGFDLKQVDLERSTIAYLDGGRGPLLVIIPGFGDDSRTWLQVARPLRQSYRVVIPDPPGFGRSPADPHAGYTFPEQARRLDRFLAALGLGPRALMGESMGGGIAALYAATHPEKVTSLTLLCPGGMKPTKLSPFWEEVRRGTNLLIPQTDRDLELGLRVIMANPPKLSPYIRALVLEEIQEQRSLRERLFRELRSGGDYQIQSVVGRISAPTLLLWGDLDQVLDSSAARAVARDLPTARLTMLPGCGHTLHLDCPDRVVEHHLEHDAKARAGASAR